MQAQIDTIMQKAYSSIESDKGLHDPMHVFYLVTSLMNATELCFSAKSTEEKEKIVNDIFDSIVKELVAKKKLNSTVGTIVEKIPVEKLISFIAVLSHHFNWRTSPDLSNKSVDDISVTNPTGLKQNVSP